MYYFIIKFSDFSFTPEKSLKRKEIQYFTPLNTFIITVNAQNNLRHRATRSSERNVATAARETGSLWEL